MSSRAGVTIKLWTDGKTPHMTISYENPKELFVGNSMSPLQIEKMVRDYFKRHDITEEIKVPVHMALHCLSKGFLSAVTPSFDKIKQGVLDDMNRLYNTDRILKRGKYAQTTKVIERNE